PVPFSDAFTVSVFATDTQPMTLALYSNSGSLLQKKWFIPAKGINQLRMDNLNRLPAAAYLLTITQNNNTIKEQLIKIK
ncbi:MAG TPA: T9SS type A sorting domain-containing protein, partial [Chitinophagaceae bacterium]|nr:T9SS type A sorting domain-containing protein [Chitinophagaceae bacterium]